MDEKEASTEDNLNPNVRECGFSGASYEWFLRVSYLLSERVAYLHRGFMCIHPASGGGDLSNPKRESTSSPLGTASWQTMIDNSLYIECARPVGLPTYYTCMYVPTNARTVPD